MYHAYIEWRRAVVAEAKGKFEVKGWDEKTYEELGGKAKLTRASITQDYSGDLEGSGTWELLMCYRTDGTAVYTGLGRFEGKVGAHAGTFVMESVGSFDGTKARSKWSVIDGSATRGLEGLVGKGTSVAPHGSVGTYRLALSQA
jgi:Protein of unknown function (DUF3224)